MSAYADTWKDYHARGWHPLPIAMQGEGAGKRPAVRWQTYQTMQPGSKECTEWARVHGAGNIGTNTGKTSGLLVLDFDKAKNEDEREGVDYFNEIKDKLPETPIARTGGGGLHVFLSYPIEYHITNSARQVKDKDGRTVALDVRAEGGFIVLPPSVHLTTGKRYEWAEGCDPDTVELAECPA